MRPNCDVEPLRRHITCGENWSTSQSMISQKRVWRDLLGLLSTDFIGTVFGRPIVNQLRTLGGCVLATAMWIG